MQKYKENAKQVILQLPFFIMIFFLQLLDFQNSCPYGVLIVFTTPVE